MGGVNSEEVSYRSPRGAGCQAWGAVTKDGPNRFTAAMQEESARPGVQRSVMHRSTASLRPMGVRASVSQPSWVARIQRFGPPPARCQWLLMAAHARSSRSSQARRASRMIRATLPSPKERADARAPRKQTQRRYTVNREAWRGNISRFPRKEERGERAV